MPILNFKTDKMFTDISDEVQALVPENFEGLVNVYSPHTTCCVFQTELVPVIIIAILNI